MYIYAYGRVQVWLYLYIHMQRATVQFRYSFSFRSIYIYICECIHIIELLLVLFVCLLVLSLSSFYFVVTSSFAFCLWNSFHLPNRVYADSMCFVLNTIFLVACSFFSLVVCSIGEVSFCTCDGVWWVIVTLMTVMVAMVVVSHCHLAVVHNPHNTAD